MKIAIANESPNPHDVENPLNCKFQALCSYQSSDFNNQNDKFDTAGEETLLLRRIRTSNPSSITCRTDRGSKVFSSLSPTQNSPCVKSPWAKHQNQSDQKNSPKYGLIGTLIREDGHIYSIAAAGDLLYTGSESRNIRVWKNMEEFSAFKSSSGLVKAIVVSGEKIFTGHQDGKVRIWKLQKKSYARVGNLPKSQDLIVKSMNPRNYVEVRKKRNVPWIKHYDAVSCLSIDTIHGLLYSGSWDRSLKVWRITDSKCLESIQAHDDAVNSVVAAFAGMVFTGSADGTVKAWRRNFNNKVRNRTKHVLVKTLLRQEHALTSLAASGAVYAGSSDGLVYFWVKEKESIEYGGVLRGHKSAVLCMAAAGKLVASGSADNSICVWRRDVGGEHVCVAVLTGHEGPVKCLAMAEDSSTGVAEDGPRKNWIVYSGSLDKSVKIWRVAEDARRVEE